MTRESNSGSRASVGEQALAIKDLEVAVALEMKRERRRTAVLQGAATLICFSTVLLIWATRLAPV